MRYEKAKYVRNNVQVKWRLWYTERGNKIVQNYGNKGEDN